MSEITPEFVLKPEFILGVIVLVVLGAAFLIGRIDFDVFWKAVLALISLVGAAIYGSYKSFRVYSKKVLNK
jgi:type IV secretory pathway VirB2 component (pilin)